jgi:hypothetical protein
MIYTRETIKLLYTVYAFGLCIGVNSLFHKTGIKSFSQRIWIFVLGEIEIVGKDSRIYYIY